MTLPKAIPSQPGGQNIVRYFTPHPQIFWPPSNNQWQNFVCVSYLLDNIYHYIKIMLMITWVVIMLLFWHYQKLSQFDPGSKYRTIFWLPSNNKWQSFVWSLYLLDKIYWYINSINDFLHSSNAFDFYTTKNYSNLTRGSKYCMAFFDPHPTTTPLQSPPPTSNSQWQSFICLSYLLEKMYYYIKIILMISWVFMMLSLCTTNTWFHKIINGFISREL